jgi:hypothetical protein
VHVLRGVTIKNDDGAAAIDYSIFEDVTKLRFKQTGLAANGYANPNGGLVASGVLSFSVAGAGASAVLSCGYSVVPRSLLRPFAVALTNAFLDISDDIVPAAGFTSRSAMWTGFTAALIGNSPWILNADTAATTVEVRVTRGALVVLFIDTAKAANTRGGPSTFQIPELLPGDVVEARVQVAPVVLDSVLFGGAVMTQEAL